MKAPIFAQDAYSLMAGDDAEAQTYYVDFINDADRVWTMGVYQTYPDSPGLESVSWLQSRAANGGETGVKWDVDYQAMIADYSQDDGRGVYKAAQKKTTLLGRKWKVEYIDGLQQLFDDGKADREDQIIIANSSGELANLGMGMSNQGSVFKRSVLSGSNAQFIVKPTYWFGLFNDIVRGEVISSNVMVGPQKLVFEGGKNAATVRALIKGSSLVLDISYGRRTAAPLAKINEQITCLSSRPHIDGVRATSGTLKAGFSHPWEKNEYSKLSFSWAGTAGSGTCSVKLDETSTSYAVPQANLALDKKKGKLTNNTDKTISYTLE